MADKISAMPALAVSLTDADLVPLVNAGQTVKASLGTIKAYVATSAPAGPAGPTGATGPAGVAGATGPTGAMGPTGSTARGTFDVTLAPYNADPTGTVDCTAAWRAAMAAACAFGTGARFHIPAGTFRPTGTIDKTVFGIRVTTAGADATNILWAPSASQFDTGLGSVKATALAADFLTRDQTRRITDGDRIKIGANEYVLSGSQDLPGVIFAGVTATRVGNAVTFSASMAGEIENGSNLSFDAGYTVSAFNGTNGCTLGKTGLTGGAADCTWGGTGSTPTAFTANRFRAMLTQVAGSATPTFSAVGFTIPHVALFRDRMANPDAMIAYNHYEPMTVRGNDTTNQKVVIDVWDGSKISIDGLHVANMTGTGSSGANPSDLTPSIGIRTTGREFFLPSNCTIEADRPLHARALIGAPTTSVDHFHGTDMYLLPMKAAEYGMVIDGNASGNAFTMDGAWSVVGGAGAIWHKLGSNQMTNGELRGLRFEQPFGDTTHPSTQTGVEFAIRWEVQTIGLLIQNCGLGGPAALNGEANGGVRVRNVRCLTLKHCHYTGGGTATNKTFLDVDATCNDIAIENCNPGDGSTTNLLAAGFEEVLGMPKTSSLHPVASTSHYFRTASGEGPSPRFNGTSVSHKTVSLAPGASYALPLSVSGGVTSALVAISGGDSTGAILESGLFAVGAASAKLLSGTPNCAVGNVGSKLCLYWATRSSVIVLNNTAATLSVVAWSPYTSS